MVFRRRTKRSAWTWIKASVYPPRGWLRALRYVAHRLTRLPDPPHRVARGVFVGVLVSFTPLFGLHVFAAILLAYLIRGNILAALLGTLVGNPVTFPFIAVLSVQLGHLILGSGLEAVPATQIVAAFANAGAEAWSNTVAVLTGNETRWHSMRAFYVGLFKPYLIGGLVIGLPTAALFYMLSLPALHAYHRLREKRRGDRSARRQKLSARHLPGTSAPGTAPDGE